MKIHHTSIILALAAIFASSPAPAASIKTRLAALPDKVLCEGYENSNWELFIMNADGSGLRNLTNTPDIHELYNPGFSPDGKWVVATVHGGMGIGHGTLLIEADGERIVNLKTDGCRPSFSPCGKFIAWGPNDHHIRVVDFNWDGDQPSLGKTRFEVSDKKHYIYHVAWSPDGKFLTLSVGEPSNGDPDKPGTHTGACPIVGVFADNWNIVAVSFEPDGKTDLVNPPPGKVLQLTTNGKSYKESTWLPAKD